MKHSSIISAAVFVSICFTGAYAEKKVIAHRGASGYLPEHTTESAVLAHAMRADYIEQDVVLSKDGVPVVMHDLMLDVIGPHGMC